MADNITLNSGTGGAVLATDDITSVHYQIIKLAFGALDSATLVTTSAGLPVQQQGTWNIGTVTAVTDITNPVVINGGAGQTSDIKVTLDSEAVVLGAGSAAIGKLAANSGVDIGDVDVTSMPGTAAEAAALPAVFVVVAGDDGTDTQPLQLSAGGDLKVTLDSEAVAIASIAAGDNNIGNVDIVSLPAGNLGQQAMAASLSVVPASNITDATYIGDIKFGEALPAGTNAIGKLLAPDIDITTHTNYAKKYYSNAGAVTDGIVWSPASGKRWHVVTLYVFVSAAATVTIEDDLAAGDSAVWAAELAANSGAVVHFGEKYPLASGEDAADLLVTTSAGNVYITAVGYEI